MKTNEEQSFSFVNKRRGDKSTCDNLLMKAENYTVKKEERTWYDETKYFFEASVMLPAPSGQCRSLVKECFPPSTQEKLKVALGQANCYGGKLGTITGIA